MNPYNQIYRSKIYNEDFEMKITNSEIGYSNEPGIFGPALWFSLHNSAITYPRNPNNFIRNGMKQFLQSLSFIIPCYTCKEHCSNFVNASNLDLIVSSRDNLFKFFVDLHNYVNIRTGKKQLTLDEAKDLYGFDSPNGSKIRINYYAINQSL